MEGEIEALRDALRRLNARSGDEVITDSDDNDESILNDTEEDTHQPVVNTRHSDRDSQFAAKYYFKTNVCIICLIVCVNLFWFKSFCFIRYILSSEKVIDIIWTT